MIVGYTSGVYDLFHIGHLRLLKNAKALCDRLIVGITTDELCIGFKNKKPAICFEERKEIVGAIRYVDLAVDQTSMDKFHAWETYKFDIMFASAVPTEKWPAVERAFLKNFTDRPPPKIAYLPYTPNVSSTSRRNEIFER